MTTDVLERGLEAFARQRWSEAFDALTEADAEVDLGPDVLGRLATAAILIGRESASTRRPGRMRRSCRRETRRAPLGLLCGSACT